MQRELDVLLWEVSKHGQLILQFISGKTSADYTVDPMLRSAVERQFIIVGEALVRVRKHFPAEYESIEDARRVVDFRNRLVHLYEHIKDEQVWEIVNAAVPAMLQRIQTILEDKS